jgi:hypothetical protein
VAIGYDTEEGGCCQQALSFPPPPPPARAWLLRQFKLSVPSMKQYAERAFATAMCGMTAPGHHSDVSPEPRSPWWPPPTPLARPTRCACLLASWHSALFFFLLFSSPSRSRRVSGGARFL